LPGQNQTWKLHSNKKKTITETFIIGLTVRQLELVRITKKHQYFALPFLVTSHYRLDLR